MKFLLDTNVVSELRKGNEANNGVRDWFAQTISNDLWLSVLVIGELRHGTDLRRRKDPTAAAHLDKWLAQIVGDFADRILPIQLPEAMQWGQLGVPDPIAPIDALMAATALVNSMTLVTRNTAHMTHTGARLLDPFS